MSLEEVYNDHRISIAERDGTWVARIMHVRGTPLALRAVANGAEGAELCLERARAEIDRYAAFLSRADEAGIDRDGR